MARWTAPLVPDRVALVTGGAGAIGSASCEALADHGADVVVADIDADRTAATVQAVEARGRRALGVVTDLTADGAVVDLVRRAEDEFGRIDILVNALGEHLKLSAPFEESAEEGWDALYRINLLHTMAASHAVLPSMKERGWGRIVNFSSVEGIRAITLRRLPTTPMCIDWSSSGS
jgi:NAD(P)-dependent dehydrogenase (short-subunit alcohol dehydrogenase family)